jgi:signal transduction histidine kinase
LRAVIATGDVDMSDDLARLVEELREAVRARDDILATAAHELRNPMHALLLSVDSTLRIARRRGDAELVSRLEQVMLAVERYVQRANLLLDVSRINAGRLILSIESFDLAAVVRDIVRSFEAEASFSRATLDADLPEELTGSWDRIAMEQIATNLVSNAIKYGNGSPVSVSLRRIGEDAVRLSVADRGIGIPAEDQARIFGRFEQVATGHARAGFGIGLWLVRSLVEAHGGTIEIESALGQGSVFRIDLPLHTKDGGGQP